MDDVSHTCRTLSRRDGVAADSHRNRARQGRRQGPDMTRTDRPAGKHRDTYHHGDLHQALVSAGLELARSGGANAVVLREVTRRTGVSPNAAYRHFAGREDLLDEVAAVANELLAQAMNEAVLRARAEFAGSEPRERTIEVILAACRGYIDFALNEPGWFEVCWALSDRSLRVHLGDIEARSERERRLVPSDDHPVSAPDVLQAVTVLPEPLKWVRTMTSEDVRLVLRSTLFGFGLLATAGTMRLEDHDQQAGRLLSVIRSSISDFIEP